MRKLIFPALVPGSMSPSSAGDPAVFDQNGPEICWRVGPDGTTAGPPERPMRSSAAARRRPIGSPASRSMAPSSFAAPARRAPRGCNAIACSAASPHAKLVAKCAGPCD